MGAGKSLESLRCWTTSKKYERKKQCSGSSARRDSAPTLRAKARSAICSNTRPNCRLVGLSYYHNLTAVPVVCLDVWQNIAPKLCDVSHLEGNFGATWSRGIRWRSNACGTSEGAAACGCSLLSTTFARATASPWYDAWTLRSTVLCGDT